MQQRFRGAVVKKLGEGTFKEVYMCNNEVVAIIPIEGDTILNSEKQPSALKILPELVAHKALSSLRHPTAPCGKTCSESSSASWLQVTRCPGYLNVCDGNCLAFMIAHALHRFRVSNTL